MWPLASFGDLCTSQNYIKTKPPTHPNSRKPKPHHITTVLKRALAFHKVCSGDPAPCSPGNAPKWPMVASGGFFWPHTTFPSLQGRRSQWKDRKGGVWLGGQPHLVSQIKLRMSSTVEEAESIKLAQVVISLSSAYLFATLWAHRPVHKIRSVIQRDNHERNCRVIEAAGCVAVNFYTKSPGLSASSIRT